MITEARQMWRGVKQTTDPAACHLTIVVSHWQSNRITSMPALRCRHERLPHHIHQPSPSATTLTVEEHLVRCMLGIVKPRKAVGPDGVSGQVLKNCAAQLAGVFTKIFNQALSQNVIPPCLRPSLVVPLPRKTP